MIGCPQRVRPVLDLHGAGMSLLHRHLKLVVFPLELFSLRQSAGNREGGCKHRFAVADPAYNLSSVFLELPCNYTTFLCLWRTTECYWTFAYSFERYHHKYSELTALFSQSERVFPLKAPPMASYFNFGILLVKQN